MPFIDYAQLKKRIPIEDALPLLSLQLKQHGNQWRGPCISCKTGGDRALVITIGKGWYCFSAKTGGDVIGLTQHIRGGTHQEAAAFLTGSSTVPQEQRVKDATRSVQPSANLEQIAGRLETEHEECQALNLSPDTFKQFGGGYEKRGIARGNVIVQLHDSKGQLVGYVGVGKPWFPQGINLQEFVFNWHRQDAGELYLMRTPLEVLIAFENGIENCVAFLTPDIASLQLRYLASLCEAKQCTLIL